MSEKVQIIRKVDEYAVEGMGKVRMFTAIDVELAKANNEPVTVFEGFTVVGAPTPNGQMARVPVEFAIEADNIEMAFINFRENAQKRFDEMVEEANAAAKAQQSKIVTASTIPNLRISE